MRVIKISGHQLDDTAFVSQFAQAVANIAAAEPTIVVNGGGRSIKELQAAFGLPEKKVLGLRVTDAKSLWITEMVMSAAVNKLVVRALQAAGLDALGVSGVDGRILTAQKKAILDETGQPADLGFVGEIIGARADLLHGLLDLGLVPVISPVACDTGGQHYNVNADEAATAVAQAMRADQLDFVSNVPGVLRDLADVRPIAQLSIEETQQLKAEGIISGGMIPKVGSAITAITQGVKKARIVDLDGLADSGTIFVK